jgi:hypothetical protein
VTVCLIFLELRQRRLCSCCLSSGILSGTKSGSQASQRVSCQTESRDTFLQERPAPALPPGLDGLARLVEMFPEVVPLTLLGQVSRSTRCPRHSHPLFRLLWPLVYLWSSMLAFFPLCHFRVLVHLRCPLSHRTSLSHFVVGPHKRGLNAVAS